MDDASGPARPLHESSSGQGHHSCFRHFIDVGGHAYLDGLSVELLRAIVANASVHAGCQERSCERSRPASLVPRK